MTIFFPYSNRRKKKISLQNFWQRWNRWHGNFNPFPSPHVLFFFTQKRLKFISLFSKLHCLKVEVWRPKPTNIFPPLPCALESLVLTSPVVTWIFRNYSFCFAYQTSPRAEWPVTNPPTCYHPPPPYCDLYCEQIHKGAGKTKYTHHPYHKATSLRCAVLTAVGWDTGWLPVHPTSRSWGKEEGSEMALGCTPSPSPLFYFLLSFPQFKPTVLPPTPRRSCSPRRLNSLSVCVCFGGWLLP